MLQVVVPCWDSVVMRKIIIMVDFYLDLKSPIIRVTVVPLDLSIHMQVRRDIFSSFFFIDNQLLKGVRNLKRSQQKPY